jgi:hypothetical protein
VGKPTVPSAQALLFLLALLPVLIWLAALLMVAIGLALGIVESGDGERLGPNWVVTPGG